MVYSDARDNVTGVDGKWYTSNQASIWRWRQAYQDEMSARVKWSVLPEYGAGSHPLVVVLNGSCGGAPQIFDVRAGDQAVLDASATYDPDSNRTTNGTSFDFHWFQYKEPTIAVQGTDADVRRVPSLNFTLSQNGRVAFVVLPTREEACTTVQAQQSRQQGISTVCQQYHVVLEVTGSGEPPIRRYRRAILKVLADDGGAGKQMKRDEL